MLVRDLRAGSRKDLTDDELSGRLYRASQAYYNLKMEMKECEAIIEGLKEEIERRGYEFSNVSKESSRLH